MKYEIKIIFKDTKISEKYIYILSWNIIIIKQIRFFKSITFVKTMNQNINFF